MSKNSDHLPSASTVPQEAKILYIPQGCYGEISINKTDQFRFIGTANVQTCCHILVSNTRTGRAILCHADVFTDLTDKSNGLPSWVDKVCEGTNLDGLRIDIAEGNTPNKSRWLTKEGKPFYYTQIVNTLMLHSNISDVSTVFRTIS